MEFLWTTSYYPPSCHSKHTCGVGDTSANSALPVFKICYTLSCCISKWDSCSCSGWLDITTHPRFQACKALFPSTYNTGNTFPPASALNDFFINSLDFVYRGLCSGWLLSPLNEDSLGTICFVTNIPVVKTSTCNQQLITVHYNCPSLKLIDCPVNHRTGKASPVMRTGSIETLPSITQNATEIR